MISSYFVFAYAGLAIPVIGVGVAADHVGNFRAVLGCSIVLALLCVLAAVGISGGGRAGRRPRATADRCGKVIRRSRIAARFARPPNNRVHRRRRESQICAARRGQDHLRRAWPSTVTRTAAAPPTTGKTRMRRPGAACSAARPSPRDRQPVRRRRLPPPEIQAQVISIDRSAPARTIQVEDVAVSPDGKLAPARTSVRW